MNAINLKEWWGRVPPRVAVYAAIVGVVLAAAIARPTLTLGGAGFIWSSLIAIAPLVIPGVLLSAWVAASGAGPRLGAVFGRNVALSVLAASAIGAVTPVCGVTVLPLMAGLLASGVPLAPVMAFWLSSPVTDPAMMAATAALLGVDMAIAKTAAAFLIGLLGGGVTACLARSRWTVPSLRAGISMRFDTCGAGGGDVEEFHVRIWSDPARRHRFTAELLSMMRLLAICLIPAFAAEFLLQRWLEPDALVAYVGAGSPWAIPLAVLVGAPAYLDGYAALPLTRSLIAHGMTPGAALAFLVSGSVVSVWGAIAIAPVLRVRPFVLFLALAVVGSIASGYLFEMLG